MRNKNQETSIDTSWHKILPFNGFSLIRAKQRLRRRRTRVYESSSSRHTDQKFTHSSIRDKWHYWKSRTKSDRRNFSSIVTIRIGCKVMDWFYEYYCYLRNNQDLLTDGDTPYESRFWESFKGSILPFAVIVEYHPISSRDQTRIPRRFGRVSTDRIKRWRWSPCRLLIDPRWLHL